MTVDFDAIKKSYDEKNRFLENEYNRNLPFQDAMFDRWERAEHLGFGKGSSIYNSAHVFGKPKIGKNVWIGPNVILDASAGDLTIGDNVTIAAGTQIYTHDNILKTLSGGEIPMASGSVIIGDNVYVGSQCVINKDIEIGSQSVIAANSFVHKDIDTRTVVAGTPAKKIGVVVGEGKNISLKYDK